ncbi:3-hydroxyisobutyryl-CoA hydrolase 1 [Zea mays]|uniref:3-hydroxyisobutyryl-CoA hydrolase n=1 Tax=Zea mays TaxID=4577 RepID=A0A1D6F8I4_MAIZE|nr:3-hydroxyisobutyryl-CoA hydrolase 1 [Zea mays]
MDDVGGAAAGGGDSKQIKGLLSCFTAFVKDDGVKLLIMKGSGRAFCAGGDVVAGVQSINNEGWKWGADFFRDQYFLNYIIATCIKPQVSLLTGIVMGGGAGVSLHGKFRVATDNTVFAMPETSLGLFPDVGASYFLARLPGFYGEYVALVGARLDGAEMLACGLATHFVPSNRMLLLEESLKKVDTSNSFVVCSIIDQFCQQPSLKQKSSLNRLEIINKCFSNRTVEEIISSLEEVASNSASKWVAQTIQYLKKASPTSLKITLRSIREGRTQTVGECLQREYRMVCHVVRGDFSRDIFEVIKHGHHQHFALYFVVIVHQYDGGLFWGACSGCLQGWNKCMMMQLKSISLGLMIQSGKIWTYLSCVQMEELWSPSFE